MTANEMTRRETVSLNGTWRFQRGDQMNAMMRDEVGGRVRNAEWLKADNMVLAKPDYDDSQWDRVRVPHDFVIEGAFTPDAEPSHGSLPVGIAWYRRTFDLPASDKGRSLWLEFDGVFRDCGVWVNGIFAGRHLSGYTSFHVDITDLCVPGQRNAVVVRVDASRFELWSYEGGGIYRAVRLIKTAPVHIAPWGTFVRPSVENPVQPAVADCTIETLLCNDNYDAVEGELFSQLCDSAGATVAEVRSSFRIDGQARLTLIQETVIAAPRLWCLEDPVRYTLRSRVIADGETLDAAHTPFGIRHLRFDADQGFCLNGRPVKIKGVCCHQDHAGVGVAVPPRLQAWRIEQLKSMGCNAIRTAHNPPDPALLDACDRLGMLVMDENRLLGTSAEVMGQLEHLIRRDRNHPSVILWSLGNEEMGIQGTMTGIRLMRRMQALVHRLDPTRPVTYAMNNPWIDICDTHAEAGFTLDVFGANYMCGPHAEMYDEFHRKHTDWPLIAVETASTWSMRGVYVPRRLPDGGPAPAPASQWLTGCNPKREDFVSAYGELYPMWGGTAEATWRPIDERPHVAGTFVWTGFDYRGETGPYPWPAIVSNFGILDLCGFPKDNYYYYRSWWRAEPLLHIFPHWNWAGREGEPIDVWCFSNCAAVELFLNGRSLGRKTMPRTAHLEWPVPYAPGRLEAIGYDTQGKQALSAVRETTGAPHALRLCADRNTLTSDGEDLAVVEVTVIDAEERIVPNAELDIAFDVGGPGRIIGAGNGDPFSHEPDKAPRRRTFAGHCQVLVQTTDEAGTIKLRAAAQGVKKGQAELITQK